MNAEDRERLKKYKPDYNLKHGEVIRKTNHLKTNVVYMDDQENVVDYGSAKKASIFQEDELGRMFEETIGYFQDPSEDSNKKSR